MYINREISWLEFNQRVLAQAMRRELPLLEDLVAEQEGSNLTLWYLVDCCRLYV